ncbi:MAG: ammonium transporter [Myxococcales bacterium]
MLVLALCAGVTAARPALADDGTDVKVMLDTLWVIIAGALVFFMNAGFGLLETGLVRSKNAVNVLAKNFTVAAIAGLAFYAVGFGLMFGDGTPLLGLTGFFLGGADTSPAMGDAYSGVFGSLGWAGVPLEAKFFFQACFAMTAASIVSGAVAERIKFQSFLVFSLLLIALVYPVTGHWIWGGGWLAERGFWDFAGSTQVHALGGFAALTGAIVLGPRRGKYGRNGEVRPIPGHNIALATAGGFILWLGWIGFNAGSTMAADPAAISRIAAATVLASFAGIVGSLVATWVRARTFDLTMMINGCLAGLVAVTAPCAFVSLPSAVLIGLVGGLLVVPAVVLFDRARVDDPVGATSVHLVGGIWGTLAVGLFAEARFSADVGDGLLFGGGASLLATQALGVAAVGVFVVLASTALWLLIRRVMGLRVDAEEEYLGLDLAEMGMEAYPADGAGHQVAGTSRQPAPAASHAPTLARSAAEAP